MTYEKVIYVSDPSIKACPLASHLYKGLKAVDSADTEALKRQIKKIIESKIRDFGFCTAKSNYCAATARGLS